MSVEFNDLNKDASDQDAIRRKAPALVEIFGMPLIGIAVVELFHTSRNELFLLFVPFVIVVLRLFLIQFQTPPQGAKVSRREYKRAAKVSLRWNQLSLLPLMLLEFVSIVASSPTVPIFVWVILAGFFVLYVFLRLLSREEWFIAATGTP